MILFFNAFHNGDCFISKGWVEAIIEQLPEQEFLYSHNNHPSLLQDIKAKYLHPNNAPVINQLAFHPHVLIDNTILIQTWSGTFRNQEYGAIIPPLGHSTFIRQHLMFKKQCELLNKEYDLGLSCSDDPKDYISKINFEKFNIAPVDNFVKEKVGSKKIILFCNNDVKSGQSDVGDLQNVISTLCERFKGCVFVSTKKLPLEKENLYYTNDILNLDCDLNEIGYLSTFSELIIGKNSGAHIFTQNKQNMEDPKKTFYCLGHEKSDNLPDGLELPAKNLHTSLFGDESLINIFTTCIEKL